MTLHKIAPLLALLSLAAAPLIAGSRSEAVFKEMRSLAGEWEGKDDHGMAVKTNFRVRASKTAVLEALSPSRMEEMIKLYGAWRKNDSSAGIQVQVLDRQIPVSFQDFEAALFFFLVGFLIGIELLEQRSAVKTVVGNRRVLEDDGYPVIPAAVSSVV